MVKFMMFFLCIMDYELDECDSTNTKQIIQHGNTNIAANLAKKRYLPISKRPS